MFACLITAFDRRDTVAIWSGRLWAQWCGPCRVMAPIFNALADDMQGRAQFGEVDLDKSPDLAVRYGVQSIPTVLLFKNGMVIDRLVGAVPKQNLLNFVSQHSA
ncbi:MULTISPECIES: thioredoxin [Alcaligenes]|uniref:Thioredoxin n=1 Tax=Alcaligenes phenolicus TaxID=232846 RepID=A0AAW5VM05_9BURK|nr:MULTISPECIES: thioredoxin [Alcaligenes]MCR4143580.1 thioredoxin [Alcaligenes faecalis]MCX5565229.1 thioredoxin [Alcaligenes phenolicus]